MKKTILILVPLLALGGLIGWRIKSKSGNDSQLKGQMAARRAASVEVTNAAPATVASTLIAAGTLDSPFKVQLAPRTAGKILSLTVREGDTVSAGQVLVKIDPATAQASLSQAQANVAEAKSRLAQAQLGATPNNAGVKGQIDQQTANLINAKAELTQTQKTVDATNSALASAVSDNQGKVDTAQNALDTAKANLEKEKATRVNLKVKLDRAKELLDKGYIARKDWEDASTALDVQDKQVLVATQAVATATTGVATAKNQLAQSKTQLDIAKTKGLADIGASKAKVTQAQSALNVAKANISMNPAYQQNINALKAAVSAAQAQVDQAQVQVNETDLKSSINGVVTARNADEGALASPGSPVLVIQQLDWLFFIASVPVEDGDKIRVGQQANILIDSPDVPSATGTITNINPSADPQSRQMAIRIKVENADHKLRPGMFGKINFISDAKKVDVAVPKEAVTYKGKSATVAVVGDDNKVQIRNVTTGVSDDKLIEIKDGVKAGEKVVTLTYSPLKDGSEVKIGTGRGGGGDKGGPGGGQGGGRRRRGGGDGSPGGPGTANDSANAPGGPAGSISNVAPGQNSPAPEANAPQGNSPADANAPHERGKGRRESR